MSWGVERVGAGSGRRTQERADHSASRVLMFTVSVFQDNINGCDRAVMCREVRGGRTGYLAANVLA